MSGFFLQGNHGIGKSTLLQTILKQSKLVKTGYYVQRIVDFSGSTVGFRVRSLSDDQDGELHLKKTLAVNDLATAFIRTDGVKMNFDTEQFVQVATSALKTNLAQAELVVMDELGGIELLDSGFYKLVCRIISTQAVVGVVKSEQNFALMNKAGNCANSLLVDRRNHLFELFKLHAVEIVTLDSNNRIEAQLRLVKFLQKIGG